jgi:hypothetical protein
MRRVRHVLRSGLCGRRLGEYELIPGIAPRDDEDRAAGERQEALCGASEYRVRERPAAPARDHDKAGLGVLGDVGDRLRLVTEQLSRMIIDVSMPDRESCST